MTQEKSPSGLTKKKVVPTSPNGKVPAPSVEEIDENVEDVQSLDVPDVDWAALANSFKGGDGRVLYLKAGKYKVRLLPFTDPKKIFVPVTSNFRGKERTKYIFLAWYMDAEDKEDPDKQIKAVLVTKKAVNTIIGQQVEGWDLFHPVRGHAISLVKTGTGSQSTVNVTPSPKEIPIPASILRAAKDVDLQAVAKDWSENQAARGAEENGGSPKEEEDY